MLPWGVGGGVASARPGWVVVMSAARVGSGLALRPLRDEMIAARMRVFAEPTRIRLLGLLDEGEATVQQLTDRMQTTHQNVSKHWACCIRRVWSVGARRATPSCTR
jgi:hypothetical protein